MRQYDHAGSVLICTPQRDMRRLLVEALEARGFEVSAADDGALTVQLVSEIRFAVVIVDPETPDLPPLEALRQLTGASLIVLGDPPAIAGDESHAGAIHHIGQPCPADALVDRIEALCGRPTAPAAIVRRPDHVSRAAAPLDDALRLTRTERKLLRCLASRAGEAVGLDELLEAVLGPGARDQQQLILQCIERLTSRLSGGDREPLIHEVSSGRYRIAPS